MSYASNLKPARWGLAAIVALLWRPCSFPFFDAGTRDQTYLFELLNRASWIALVIPLAWLAYQQLARYERSCPSRYYPGPIWLSMFVGLALAMGIDFVFADRPIPPVHVGTYALETHLMPWALVAAVALFLLLRTVGPAIRQRFVLAPDDAPSATSY